MSCISFKVFRHTVDKQHEFDKIWTHTYRFHHCFQRVMQIRINIVIHNTRNCSYLQKHAQNMQHLTHISQSLCHNINIIIPSRASIDDDDDNDHHSKITTITDVLLLHVLILMTTMIIIIIIIK